MLRRLIRCLILFSKCTAGSRGGGLTEQAKHRAGTRCKPGMAGASGGSNLWLDLQPYLKLVAGKNTFHYRLRKIAHDKKTYLNRRSASHFLRKTRPLTQGKLGLNCKESCCYRSDCHMVHAFHTDLPGSAGKRSCNDLIVVRGRPSRYNFGCNLRSRHNFPWRTAPR